MSQDELKRDVDRIFRLATSLAAQDGLPLTALRDPEMSRCYMGKAVTNYAESVITHRKPSFHKNKTLPAGF